MPASAPVVTTGLQNEPGRHFTARDLPVVFLVFVAYTAVAEANHYLINLHPPGASIWVPAGIALAAVLLRGRRMVPAVFLGSLTAALITSLPLLPSMSIAAGNAAEVLFAAYLVERFAGGTKAFTRPADFLRFCVLAGGIATAVSALSGAAVLTITPTYGDFHFLGTFLAWWTGDALGVLVVAPFLVLLLNGTHHPLHLREFAEILALLVGLSIVCIVSFGPPTVLGDNHDITILLVVPFLVWVAIRFCPLEAAGACLLVSGFATWGSLHGYGPFANSTLPLPLAAYLCVTTAMTLTGAATLARQREISEQLLENFYRLEQSKDFEISRLNSELEFFREELTRRVHAKSRITGKKVELQRGAASPHLNANDVLWFLEAETENILYVSPSYETIWGRPLADLKRDAHAWLDAVIPEDREYAILFVGQEFPGDRVETTYRVQRPDGSIRWIFDRGFVVREPSGRPVRYLGLASDITEQVLQGEVVPIQLEQGPPISLREGEGRNQIRRKRE